MDDDLVPLNALTRASMVATRDGYDDDTCITLWLQAMELITLSRCYEIVARDGLVYKSLVLLLYLYSNGLSDDDEPNSCERQQKQSSQICLIITYN